MYRETALQDCLFGLVGFRQNLNPDYPTLTPSLLVSTSGLYFQDDHPLVNIEYLDQALKNYDKWKYPDFVNATVYGAGVKVRSTVDGNVYESLQGGNQGHEPSASPAWWTEVPLFSQKAEALVRNSINKMASAVYTRKAMNELTKSIFDNVQLFDGAGSILDKEIKRGRFVGFQVVVENHRDLVTVIKRLGTQFTQPNPEFKLYVYHSSQVEPVKVFTLNLTKSNSFEWTKILDDSKDFFLRYLSEIHSPGGAFYIGYYEDLLVGQAINRGYDFGRAPAFCGRCNNNYAFYASWSPWMRVTPIEIPASALVGILPTDPEGAKLWDINANQYQYLRNYGLNFDLTVRCDVTDFMCSEKYLFVQPILKQVTVDVLTELAYSTRNNVISKEVKAAALHALNNGDNGTAGAVKKLDKAIDVLNFNLSDLNDACLPPNQIHGVTWGTV